MSTITRRSLPFHAPCKARPNSLVNYRTRHLALSTNPSPLTLTSSRSFHTTLKAYWLGAWLRRGTGMRRRIGAWAESFGIIEPDRHDHRSRGGDGGEGLEEVQGEEMFLMPGWAVVKYRDEKVDEGAPGTS